VTLPPDRARLLIKPRLAARPCVQSLREWVMVEARQGAHGAQRCAGEGQQNIGGAAEGARTLVALRPCPDRRASGRAPWRRRQRRPTSRRPTLHRDVIGRSKQGGWFFALKQSKENTHCFFSSGLPIKLEYPFCSLLMPRSHEFAVTQMELALQGPYKSE